MLRAEVFINIPVKRVAHAYSYRVPEAFSCINAGWRVVVPFGGRRVEGFVVQITQTEDEDPRLKDIVGAVDDEAWFTPQMIEASRSLANFYLCPTAEIMRLFMPGKSGVKIETRYDVCVLEDPSQLSRKGEVYRRIYAIIQNKGPLRLQDIQQDMPDLDGKLSDILEMMIRHQWIKKTYMTKKRAAEMYSEELSLSAPLTDEVRGNYRRRPAQLRLLESLAAYGGRMDTALLLKQGFSRTVIHALVKGGAAKLQTNRIFRDSYRQNQRPADERPPLSEAQQAALDAIFPSIEKRKGKTFLLHGVTGSGKTRVYLDTVEQARRQGRQAIVLVPEIALTGQLVQAFRATFPDDMIVIHSRLSVSERNDAFFRIRRGDVGVIIGARSALFAPTSDLGVVIMDEEQDMSYKQDEAPRYHARTVAETLANLHGAVLILGSATPSMETFYRAKTGEMVYLSMPNRIGNRPLPTAEAIDMRAELKAGNRKVLSRPVQKMLAETAERKEQAILLLNRRGYSTFVMCRSCGYVAVCPECGLPMVYHKDGRLLCHHCDIHGEPPEICPQCGSKYIRYFGSGTEKLETQIHELLPMVRVIRMDRDTTQKKFAHADILRAFRAGEYDVLLGTQMVAKGHDVPNVTAVGIISADAALNLPDFRASERCFMMITQAAGRAGRGDKPGHVLVQCYTPEHYAVKNALAQDYEEFYNREIAMRQALFFPPFCRLVKLTFLDGDAKRAGAEAEEFRRRFMQTFQAADKHRFIGPAPAVIEKYHDVYRFNALVKTADLDELREFLREAGLHLRQDVWIDIDPIMA
ncbi:MAG: primosomal protein N' [Schwartzia sp.]|nr:primosomal protein N' [Schwartzia sp. (in: firmicutes)]